jgi:hypothetical protein
MIHHFTINNEPSTSLQLYNQEQRTCQQFNLSSQYHIFKKIMLRIIIELVASRDFGPYQLGEMIYLNLVVKFSHSSFDIFFSLPTPQMYTQPH